MHKTTLNSAVAAERFADVILDCHPNECLVMFEMPDGQREDVIHEFENRGYAVICKDHVAIARRRHQHRHHGLRAR